MLIPSGRSPVGRLATAAACTVLVATIALAGCSALPPGSLEPSGPASASDGPHPVVDIAEIERGLAPLIDPARRDLLAVIAPEEAIEATVDVADAKRIAALALARGLAAELVNAGTVLVIGPRNDVIAFVADARPTRIELNEDHRPDRWLPEAAPSVIITNSGAPYRFAPLAVDRTKLDMTEERRADLLGELARAISTIDGRPYDRLTVEGECDPAQPPVCLVRASGVTIGAGGNADSYLIGSDAGTGGEARVASSGFQSVPRALARAAEWIARHDLAASAAIGGFDACCGSTWDPVKPGVITMAWWRPCAAAVRPPNRAFAETGDCFEGLEIVVDVRLGVVVSIHRRPGPGA